MGDHDADLSWYDITLEEETELEREHSNSSISSRSHPLLNESRKSFSVLSPLKEADRALEMKEEFISKQAIKEEPEDYIFEEYKENEIFSNDIKQEPGESEDIKYTTPTKRGLGPRASQRHSARCERDNASPSRRVKLELRDESPRNVKSRLGVPQREESPVSSNVKSRLGPRASSRHSTPDHSNKRSLVRDSPRRETDHVDKKSRLGTPNRGSGTPTRGGTPTRDQHVFRTPEIRSKRNTRSMKTPNSDSRVYEARKHAGLGKGKDLFGNTTVRRRGNSESSKESDSPVKPLTEEQIAKREKQVRYGKVTDGYQNYKSVVPKSLRDIRDPATPKKDYPYSKRCWDGLVRSWRRKLHEWDNPSTGLDIRAKYSRNNADLKRSGLINGTGEVVMYAPPQDDGTATEFIDTGTAECSTAECSTAECSTAECSAGEEISESQFAGSLRISPVQKKIELDADKWQFPEFSVLEDMEEIKSQESEYSRLVGNATEFPDSDSDTSYRLSQDSQQGSMEEEEGMEVDEAMEVQQHFGIAV